MSAAQLPAPAGDTLTILTTAGPRLTKVWDSATGKPQSYERAQQVSVQERHVTDIYSLGVLLDELEVERNSCIIRGRFIGHVKARELYPQEIEQDRKRGKTLVAPKEGFTLRRKTFFKDQPLHYCYFDIDSFKPVGLDPVLQPEACINQFIETFLPACFQGIAYHWQLSSGAGHPDNAGVLKAHVAFWLTWAYTGDDLEAWVKAEGLPIDVTVFRTVQPNYTAAPVFTNGVADPVPVRSGLCEGFLGDSVDLVIDPVVLVRAKAERKERAEMVDPREKDGLIGLFHRTFEIEEVVERWLSDVFEFVTDTRLTWLLGGGAGEGAGVTDNRQGIFNTHNTDPLGGRATNKWDLVRHYVFGHLDAGLSQDERFLLGPGGWPSQQAMVEMVRGLPEMQQEQQSALDAVMAQIASAVTARSIEDGIAPEVARSQDLGDADRAAVAAAMRERLRALGAPVAMETIRGWLRPVRQGGTWVHLTDDGRPLATLENFEVLLASIDATVRYNVISKQTEIRIPGFTGTLDNLSNTSLTRIISEAERVQMPTRHVPQFVLNAGDANLFNPVLEWIDSRPWDGVSRLQAMFDSVQSPMPSALKALLMRKWLVQAVAAAAEPNGISGQGILTFVGAQNKGKTTWFMNLAPRELVHTGLTLDLRSKDSILTAIKYWIVELGEVDATFRKSDVSALKSFVTQRTDVLRRPYAVADSQYPRRTVFGASVNDDQFLADKSGNRRFWVIPVESFTFDHGIDMQQLWAEVAVLYRAGEGWSLAPGELEQVNSHNEGFEVVDPIEERIASAWDWTTPCASWSWLSVTEVLAAIGIRDPSKQATISGGIALKKLNGGQRRKSHGRVLHAVPGPAADFLN